MKIITETTLKSFRAWAGAVDTQEKIIDAGKADEFGSMIEELYPDGLTNTQLNDLLWFEEEWIYEALGISTEEETEEIEEDE